MSELQGRLQLNLRMSHSLNRGSRRLNGGQTPCPLCCRAPGGGPAGGALLTWLLWMEMAQASLSGSCCRLRWVPPADLNTQRSGFSACVTPHRKRTCGSPGDAGKSPKLSTHGCRAVVKHAGRNADACVWRYRPCFPDSKATTTPRAPFTRPWVTSRFFVSMTLR